MTFRARLTTRQREALYLSECERAREAGKGEFPICNLCQAPVTRSHLWDVSHDPAKPRAWGGTEFALAHRRCNRLHGALVVVPAISKAKRQWRNDRGITGPGLGLNPLPGGRGDRLKKKISGEVVVR